MSDGEFPIDPGKFYIVDVPWVIAHRADTTRAGSGHVIRTESPEVMKASCLGLPVRLTALFNEEVDAERVLAQAQAAGSQTDGVVASFRSRGHFLLFLAGCLDRGETGVTCYISSTRTQYASIKELQEKLGGAP